MTLVGSPLAVVFFGTPAFAVPTLAGLLASRHRVVGVVTQPDKPRGRGQRVSDAPVKALAVERGLHILKPQKLARAEFEAPFLALGADLGVVAAYGKILPEWMLSAPRLGMINVHASGGNAMMQAAARAARETSAKLGRPSPLMIGVTVLTSMDQEALRTVGVERAVLDQVVALARMTQQDRPRSEMVVNLVSFGFKHGPPLDADLVFDVRCLPNPHFVDRLRPLTGRDPKEGILVAIPPHRGTVTLTFELHNRHMYSEELIKAKKAFRQYTATIGVLTMDNTLIERALAKYRAPLKEER